MWKKKKSKKSIMKKFLKCIVDWKPMSQIVHYTIIFAVAWVFAVNIVRAFDNLEKLTVIR